MKIKFIILIIILFTVGCSPTHTDLDQKQSKTPPSKDTESVSTLLPQDAPVPSDASNITSTPDYPTLYQPLDLIDKSNLENKDQTYLNLLFAPIGWSKDGKFAYITAIDGGGAGNDETGFFRWVIQDMTTDKRLWESELGLEKGLPSHFLNNNDKKEIFKWVFTNLRTKYNKYFEKYGIIIDTNLKISKFPLTYKNCQYKGLITDICLEEKDGIPNIISKYKVIVSKNSMQKIFKEYSDEHSRLLNAQIGGYIKSPYEPRIALIVCSIERGLEGPPHPVQCSFVGCHLEIGY